MPSAPWKPAFDVVGWQMPPVLAPEDCADAVEHLRAYLARTALDGPEYSGAYSERFCGGGDRDESRDVITAEDVLSLQLLSIGVTRSAGSQSAYSDIAVAAGLPTDRRHHPVQLPEKTPARPRPAF